MLAASTIAWYYGVSAENIRIGLETYIPENFRSQILSYPATEIILDCYNANPSSMELALKEFSKTKRRNKIAILGSMKELGSISRDEHIKIINLLTDFGVETAILIGKEFESLGDHRFICFPDAESASDYIKKLDLSDSSILLKGSRANALEKVADEIKSMLN
jgi:UDP-N-acetylmuramoyl-tripeptide--D-alanyl-D-alanine ligase